MHRTDMGGNEAACAETLHHGPRDQMMVTTLGYSDLYPGNTLSLTLDLSKAMLFSAETGQCPLHVEAS